MIIYIMGNLIIKLTFTTSQKVFMLYHIYYNAVDSICKVMCVLLSTTRKHFWHFAMCK